MRAFVSAFLAVALCGAVGAQAQSRLPEVPLSRNHAGIEINVDGSGGLIVVASLHDIGGRLAACGMVFPDGAKSTVLNLRRRVMEEVVVTFQGRPLPVHATAFAWYDSLEAAKAGKARCSVSRRAWQAAYGSEPPGMRMRGDTFSN